MFDVDSGEKVSTSHPFPHPSSAAFSPAGSLLAVKNTSGRIAVLYSATGEVVFDHKNQQEGEGSEVLFSPDGTELIDGSWKGVVTIRKTLEGNVVTQEEFPGEMICRVSHDSNRRFWLIEHHPKVRPGEDWADYGYLTFWEWPFEKRKSWNFTFDFYISSATLSPDGRHICVLCTRRKAGRWIEIIRVSDGGVASSTEPIEIGGTGDELVWSADGKFVGSVQKRKSVFYRATDLKILTEVPCRYPSEICFPPNTNRVVLGSWNSSILADIGDVLAGKVKMPKPRET
jgi:WD40 repeat protein